MTTSITQFTIVERVQHFWIRHWSVDVVIALVCLGVWALVARCGWVPRALTEVPAESRRAMFQILATVAATMGGFTLTSISILVNLLRTPMTTVDRLLPAEDKRRVGAVFIGVLPWLLVLFVTALAGIGSDVNMTSGYWWFQMLLVGATLATVCSISRIVWVLRRLLVVATD